MKAAIDVQNLTKIYKSHLKKEGLGASFRSLFHRDVKEFRAVDNVSFSLAEGELVGMLGANGAGKTTVLKMLSGLLYPTSGSARVLNYIPWERTDEFKRNFSIVMGQRNQLWWDLPAGDSYLLNKEIYGIPDDIFRKRRDNLAERLDVADKLHIQVRRLSLGERMKCELISALLHQPKVLYLDEPTIGLDVVAQQSVREFIREYNQESGTTIILTSHYMADIEELCERVIVVDHGKIGYDGSLTGLVEAYVSEKFVTIIPQKSHSHSTAYAQFSKEELSKFGEVVEFSPEIARLRIPRDGISHSVAGLLQAFAVQDLSIEEMPVEDVVRHIFS